MKNSLHVHVTVCFIITYLLQKYVNPIIIIIIGVRGGAVGLGTALQAGR